MDFWLSNIKKKNEPLIQLEYNEHLKMKALIVSIILFIS